MLDFLLQGKLFMIPLVTCAVLAIAVIIERAIVLKEIRAYVGPFLEKFNALITAGKLKEAEELCDSTPHPVSRMLAAGLTRHGEVKRERSVAFIHDQVDKAVSTAGVHAVSLLEHRLGMLASISTLAPLFGFAGTVTGMIAAFGIIASASTVDVSQVALGISEALNTTASGLVIGITATLGYSHYTNKIEDFVGQLEDASNRMLAVMTKDILAERYGEQQADAQAG